MESKILSRAKASLFTEKLSYGNVSYNTNMISVNKLRKAFPKMNRILSEREGWKPCEKICFQVYHRGENTVILSPEDYLFRFELTESEFTYGLTYLFSKQAIKLEVR